MFHIRLIEWSQNRPSAPAQCYQLCSVASPFLSCPLQLHVLQAAATLPPHQVTYLGDTPGPQWDVFRNALAELGYFESGYPDGPETWRR
jgi:hypothetical protein